MNKPEHEFIVQSSASPVVELSADGVYVWFQPGRKASRTLVRSRWPVMAVDLDEDNEVIGIECAPLPKTFSLQELGRKAGVLVPDMAAARAQIKPIADLKAATASA